MQDAVLSVIVPVYNTEQYLEETIESVIVQTIGFEDYIQLILVDNVTKDNSALICKRYVEKYPQNIEYIKVKENHGPCSARNAGMSIARGKYITFLDSDDKWENNAFEKALAFIEAHKDDIDLVAGRIRHFDAFDDYDLFDFKFNDGDTIVNIFEKPSYVQFSLCSTIIKTDVAKQYIHDERIRHAEDMKFLTEIIFEKGKYGLCADAMFYYRMRLSKNSTLDTTIYSNNWYNETIKYSYFYLIDLSIQKFGRVIDYLQYILLSEVRGRLEKEIPSNCSVELLDDYRSRIKELLQVIADDKIMNESHLCSERKFFALTLKHKESGIIENIDGINPFESGAFNCSELTYLRSVLAIEDMAVIIGFIRCVKEAGPVSIEIQVSATDKIKIIRDTLSNVNNVYCLNQECCVGESFRICLPYKKGEKISFFAKMGDEKNKQNVKLLDKHTFNGQLFSLEGNELFMTGVNGNQFPTYYLFPFEDVRWGERICIYGAGYIGSQFLEQIKLSKYCKVLAVVDKCFDADKIGTDGIKRISPEGIFKCNFDKIVIAIGKREIAAEVVEYLKKNGIPKEKLIVRVDRMIPWS